MAPTDLQLSGFLARIILELKYFRIFIEFTDDGFFDFISDIEFGKSDKWFFWKILSYYRSFIYTPSILTFWRYDVSKVAFCINDIVVKFHKHFIQCFSNICSNWCGFVRRKIPYFIRWIVYLLETRKQIRKEVVSCIPCLLNVERDNYTETSDS